MKKGNNRKSRTGICGVQKTATGRHSSFYRRSGMKTIYGKTRIGIKEAALDRQGFEKKRSYTRRSERDLLSGQTEE